MRRPAELARDLRRRGARKVYEGRARSRVEQKEGELLMRDGLELIVDAFLFDRRGQRDCFALAHSVGEELSSTFGCPLEWDDKRGRWSNRCGVAALHSRFGMSPGGPSRGRCSICGAGDFECDHIPGEEYAGEFCVREIVEMDLREVSLVTRPRDPRTYRVSRLLTTRDIEREIGQRLPKGAVPVCTHCQECPGRLGPTEEDLDPASWSI